MTSTVEPRARSANSEVVDGLLALSRTLVATVARSLAQLDDEVTLGQYRVLVVLASDGPQRTSDLAAQLDVTSSTVTRMCDRLYRKQLVRRYRRSDDRRATWVMLTPAGQALLGDVMRQRRANIVRLARSIPPQHRDSLAAGLHAFVTAAGELPENEWWKRWRVAADRDPLTVEG
jgi:DNA-binding MarR family transcriptional regulator